MLIYLTSTIYPLYRASNIQTLWVAKTFSKILGDDFVFVVGRKQDGDLWKDINYLETGYARRRFRSLYYFFWFPNFIRKYLYAKKEGGLVVYARDPYLILTAMAFKKLFGYKIVIEYHNPPFGLTLPYGATLERLIMNVCDYILPTTRSMKDYLVGKYKVSEKKFLFTPNGVDVSCFSISNTQNECRNKCGLPTDKRIVLYSGHLYSRQGVHTLARTAKRLGEDIMIVFVGGDENYVPPFRAEYKDVDNILVVGNRPHEEIPFWLKSADILVVPQSITEKKAIEKAILKWACPTKIFEYMASGVPILSSDIPAIREILNDSNAYFVKPDDVESLVEGINTVLSNYDSARERSQEAYKNVQHYAWDKRAMNIIKFIKC